jgi:D-glycero-D-manno-heptose 1,7-bisphosphate phosphatase
MALPRVSSEVQIATKWYRRRAVFLDRDGVINRAFTRNGKPFPPATLQDLEILPGVAEALAALRAAGFLNVVVTNQPDVATGAQRREIVDAMHTLLCVFQSTR